MEISLRMHRPEDIETLYRIDQACYDKDTAYSRSDLRAYLGLPGAECVVAELGQGVRGKSIRRDKEQGSGREIAGFCISAHRGAQAHIITIDVLEAYQRQGIGSALLDEVERRLLNAGVHWVGLETATDNDAAVAFWQNHGYRTQGVRKGYYPRGRDAFSMTKIIGPDSST